MKKIRLNDLGGTAQKLLAEVAGEESVVIEDESGRPRYGVIPYRKPTDEQKQRAWEKLKELQKKAGAAMEEQGVTEDDLMRELLEGD